MISFVLCPVMFLTLGSCDVGPREIRVWPGMAAKQFNELNKRAGERLRTNENDWIGISSPVLLIVPYQGNELRVEGLRRGGGIIVTSNSDYLPDGSLAGPPKVDGINFNIGGGMENITEFHPKLTRYCEQLAAISKTPQPVLPSAKEISADFRTERNALTDVLICSGAGADFTYSIRATHFAGHWRHGGDPSLGFLDGTLHRRLNRNDLLVDQ